MKSKLYSILIASCLMLTVTDAAAVGFRQIMVTDPGSRDIGVGLWYPTDTQPALVPNTEYGIPVALDAPIGRTNQSLVLISHGYGGWYGGHADTAVALAAAGFIVAAPSHTGNTWSDMSSPIDQWALDRPRHVSRVIDHLLADEEFIGHFSASRIGTYGFSAGGFTALSLVGATPDLDHAKAFCQRKPDEFVCSEQMIDQMLTADMQALPKSAWGSDPRVRAASIAAPGLGFSYTKETLAEVDAEIQVWSGGLDESVPTESNAANLARLLPSKPETHWIGQANHFAFLLAACNREAFKAEEPAEYEMVCSDAPGFDRSKFHEEMHREMIRFFESSFNI